MKSPDFTYEDAERLVNLTYRTKPGKLPLIGKENELLDALNLAKQRHDEALEEHETFHDLQAGFDNVQEVAMHTQKLQVSWNQLTHTEQEWVANLTLEDTVANAYESGADPEQAQQQRLKEMQLLIEHFTPLIAKVESLEKKAHRPEELIGLKEFILVLKEFWEEHALFEKFGMQKPTSEVNSSASKLVFAAAKHLRRGYTLTNCDSVMNPRVKKKAS